MRSSFILLGLTFLLVGNAFADIYTVHPDGSGDFQTIQAAIDGVSDGDIIELTDGTFSGAGNWDVDFLGKAITLRSRSGNAEACVVDCYGIEAEIHRGFVFHTGENASTVLADITIWRGNATDLDEHELGGGVYCVGSSPTISGCIFRENYSPEYGGGLCSDMLAAPTVINCTFIDNEADWGGGGGISFMYGSGSVTGCTFINNEGGFAGGGMLVPSSNAEWVGVTDCVFIGNTSFYGGGFGT